MLYGYKNVYCSGAEVYHIGSATSGSKHNAFKVKLAARNNIYVILKNMPIIQVIISLPFLLLGVIIKYIFFRKKGLGEEYAQGIKEAFINRKSIEKIKYSNKNLFNYFKVYWILVANTIKLFLSKLSIFR
jgi:GT2 family glycosyltransferase